MLSERLYRELKIYRLGMPLPLPLSARCAAPGGNPLVGACGCCDSWFAMIEGKCVVAYSDSGNTY